MGRHLDRLREGSSSTRLRAVGGSSTASSASRRLLAARRSTLRPRIGLLKEKRAEEALSDVEQKMLDHELAIARDLQQHLLPRELPKIPGLEVSAFYRASREVGGDYYDFLDLGDDRHALVVADVSGKGIPGSMVMTAARVLVRTYAALHESPRDILIHVNRAVYADVMRGMFVTAYLAVYDARRRTLAICSAGHNPMVYYKAKNQTCYLLNPGGIALGLDKGPLFEQTIQEKRIKIERGDRFVLYTDGVVELYNPERELYSPERFYALVRANGLASSGELIRLIVEDLERHRGDAPPNDDITIVTAARAGESPFDTVFQQQFAPG